MIKNYLSVVDWVILAATIGVSVGIGIFFGFRGGGQQTTKEFLHGGRQMPLIPTILSLLVSFQSGILILGISSEMYMKGMTFAWYIFACVIALPVAAVTFVPIFYRLQLTSVFEYLELRFQSKAVRYIANVLWIVGFIFYLAIVLYAPATAMSAVSDMQMETLLIVTTAACIFYTMLGGLKAVVWTDAFQAVVMYVGLLAILIQGLIMVGGPKKAYEIALEQGRLETETTADPFVYMNVWVVIIGSAIGWMVFYCSSQASVQRYCSVSTLSKAKWSIGLLGPALFLMSPLVMFCGVVMFAYYAKCDPLRAGLIQNRDQLLPFFVLDALDNVKGLAGLFVACLYSGTLSTVSTGINSVSAVVWEDYIRKFSSRQYTERQATLINKALVVLFGVVSLCLAFAAQYMGGVFQAAMSVLTTIGSPSSGLFLYAVMFPWANKWGAISGMSISLGILTWICIGGQVLKPYRASLPRSVAGCNIAELTGLANATLPPVELVTNPTLTGIDYIYKLSYKAYGVFGIFIVIIVGVIVSLITIKDWNIPDEQRSLYWDGWYYMLRRCVSPKKLATFKPLDAKALRSHSVAPCEKTEKTDV